MGLKKDKNAYTKIIETSHELRVLHSDMADIYLARREVSIEVGNYPMAVKDVEAAIVLKRTGPEGSRSRAESMHQPGVTQAYASKVIESDVSLNRIYLLFILFMTVALRLTNPHCTMMFRTCLNT